MRAVLSFRDKLGMSAILALSAFLFLAASPACGQLLTFSKQDLIDYTADAPFGRLPDGRPNVPGEFLDRARELSSEEVWAVLQEKGFTTSTWTDSKCCIRESRWWDALLPFNLCRCVQT